MSVNLAQLSITLAVTTGVFLILFAVFLVLYLDKHANCETPLSYILYSGGENIFVGLDFNNKRFETLGPSQSLLAADADVTASTFDVTVTLNEDRSQSFTWLKGDNIEKATLLINPDDPSQQTISMTLASLNPISTLYQQLASL